MGTVHTVVTYSINPRWSCLDVHFQARRGFVRVSRTGALHSRIDAECASCFEALFPSGFASQAYARRALALGGKTFSDFLRGGPRAVRWSTGCLRPGHPHNHLRAFGRDSEFC